MADTRTVSIVMPAYNVAAFVDEALASVEAQTWPTIELVAVDDGSTDGTESILAARAESWTRPERTFRLIRQSNAGAATARNTGLDLATGSFIAFLDADDRLHSECLERLVATLDAAPDLDITFPDYCYIDETGRPLGFETTADKDRFELVDLMMANPIHSATGVLVRREAVERAGRFDPNLKACIDLDFWVRIAANRPRNVGGTSGMLAEYRKRAGQITGDWRRMRENWLRVCKKLDSAGLGLSPREFARGYGRHALYWATIAYRGGDYRDARKLVAEMWRSDPAFAATTPLGRIRTLSILASLLPERAHAVLRDGFNNRNGGPRE